MSKNPFLLVHGRHAPINRSEASQLVRRLSASLEEVPLRNLREPRPQLVSAVLGRSITGSSEQISEKATRGLGKVVRELVRHPKVETVGIWDLDAWVNRLQHVIQKLNAVQPAITLFEIQAAIPAGMISRPERIIAWAKEHLGRSLNKKEQSEIKANVISNDFFERAERVRKDLGLDYLIGVTRAMVAGEEVEEVFWNHFSTYSGKLILISTADLRSFAHKAERPFEVAVAGLAVSTLLAAINPRLDFHENRGCIFDYHPERSTIVEELKKPAIEQSCLFRVRPGMRESAQAMVSALAVYGKGT